MMRLLPHEEFARWFAAFLPGLDKREPAILFEPATVSDRSDGKIAHLDGLNLSRAWCRRQLGHAAFRETAERHIEAGAAPRRGRLYGRALAGELRAARAHFPRGRSLNGLPFCLAMQYQPVAPVWSAA